MRTDPVFEPDSPSTDGDAHERRRTPRVKARGLLYGHLVSSGLALAVKDLSLGGFSAELSLALRPGDRHEVRFLPLSGDPVTLTADVAHSRQVNGPNGAPRYVAGFAFMNVDAEARTQINRLIEQMAVVLGFENKR